MDEVREFNENNTKKKTIMWLKRFSVAILAVLVTGIIVLFLKPLNNRVTGQVRQSDLNMLARVVAAEARGEPYTGMVAVAAVMLNRVESSKFPNTLSGVVFQPNAFESVSNGLVWSRQPTSTEIAAARDAMNGVDPTYGALFFWNPSKPVNSWIWSRQITLRIGDHVFAY